MNDCPHDDTLPERIMTTREQHEMDCRLRYEELHGRVSRIGVFGANGE